MTVEKETDDRITEALPCFDGYTGANRHSPHCPAYYREKVRALVEAETARLRDEIAGIMHPEFGTYWREVGELTERADTAERERDEARAALQPFAEYAEELDAAELPDACPIRSRPELYVEKGPTAGHCRDARRALSDQPTCETCGGSGVIKKRVSPAFVYGGEMTCTCPNPNCTAKETGKLERRLQSAEQEAKKFPDYMKGNFKEPGDE